MILLLDIGNSRIKWACLENGELQHTGDASRADREFKDIAKKHWVEFDTPEQVLISNVAGPSVKKSANLWIRRRWKVKPEFIESSAEACGVSNAYEKPEQLGSDRWLAMLAARDRVKGPVCIVDCGTAITIDVIDAAGQHQGGLIIPGLELMARSLIDRAPGIPEPDDDNEGHVALFARDTDSAVAGGALYAAVALLDRAVTDVIGALGAGLTVVLTGGAAERIGPLLSRKPEYDPELVLKGLALLVEQPECDT